MRPITQWLQDYSRIKINDKNKDIYIKEYDSAVKQLEQEERLFTNTVALSSAIITIFISLFVTNSSKVESYFSSIKNINIELLLIGLIILAIHFSYLALCYFSGRQRTIVFSKRKIVIIRWILDCNYTDLYAILPNWSVHGGNNPFSIKFNGATSHFVFWFISIISTGLIFILIGAAHELTTKKPIILFLLTFFIFVLSRSFSDKKLNIYGYISTIFFFLFTTFIYFLFQYKILSIDSLSKNSLYSLLTSLLLAFIVEKSVNKKLSITRVTKKFIIIVTAIYLPFFIFNLSTKLENNTLILQIIISFLWFLSCWAIFQKRLFDHYENFHLLFGKFIAFITDYKLHWNMEFKMYEATMAVNEIKRLGIHLKELEKFTVHIEDKRFFTRQDPIDLKAIARSFYMRIFRSTKKIPSFIKDYYNIPSYLNKNSGGSTIPQQLFRTIFSSEKSLHSKKWRRKILELYFSFWLHSILSRQEILELYLASVRFEKNCFGALSAIKYFFGDNTFFELQKFTITPAIAFFLTERLSNIYSGLHLIKIKILAKRAYEENILSSDDLTELVKIYKNMIRQKKIKIDKNFDITTINSIESYALDTP